MPTRRNRGRKTAATAPMRTEGQEEMDKREEVDNEEEEDMDTDFGEVSTGASDTIPTEAGDLKKGGHVVIKDRPGKIVELFKFKNGKHGTAKVRAVALDLFNRNKSVTVWPSSTMVRVPVVFKQEAVVVSLSDDGFLSLLTHNGRMRAGVRKPEGKMGEDLAQAVEDGDKDIVCTVLGACGIEQVISVKITAAEK